MKILVTGGTVFVSRFTAEYFTQKGNEVYVLNRGNDVQSVGVHHIKADRHDLGDKLKNHRFDAVIDVTAYNGKDVLDLLNGLGEYGTYVFISSSAVYPETLPQPFNEEQPTGQNGIWGKYGTDKIEAENTVTSHISDYYILRPPYLYGPLNNVYREAFVFECAENDRPFYLPKDGSMPLQFFHVRDLCRFIELILEKKPVDRIFNVGNPHTVTVREWVEMGYNAFGKKAEFISVSGDVPQRDYFPFYDYAYKLDVSRMSGIMPDTTDLNEGLRDCMELYKHDRSLVRRKPLLEFIDNSLKHKESLK
jgi:nucleoside-diphosphate-sugar epimerase